MIILWSSLKYWTEIINLIIFLTCIKKLNLWKLSSLPKLFGQEFKASDEESESEMLANIKATVKKIYEKQAS